MEQKKLTPEEIKKIKAEKAKLIKQNNGVILK